MLMRRRPGRGLARNKTFPESADGRVPTGAPGEILSADKVFPNGTRALAPIDLTIVAGEFLTLIGPSGCGKSSLLKLIANLIEPSDGRILWWSGAFDRVGSSGRSLAFVFQDPTLMPWARVEANVRLPLDLARTPKTESSKRVLAEASKTNEPSSSTTAGLLTVRRRSRTARDARIRWPVEDTGTNSVRPSTMPRRMAVRVRSHGRRAMSGAGGASQCPPALSHVFYQMRTRCSGGR